MQAPKTEIENVIEALLFVSGQAVEIDSICEKLEVEKNDVLSAIQNLKNKHEADGINVITFSNSVQLCSNPNYAEDIATVLNPIREKQLTKAALETAAIIAYKQPVTRLDIEQIRGVNSDYALQVLQNFKLVEVVGRKDAIGKPLLFGTTDEFLKRFELQSIEDLPDYDELLERIEVLHKEFDDELYRSTEIIPEENLPDSQSKFKEENKATHQNDEFSVKTGNSFEENDLQNDAQNNNFLGKSEENNLPNLNTKVEHERGDLSSKILSETELENTLLDAFENDDGDEVLSSKDSDLL